MLSSTLVKAIGDLARPYVLIASGSSAAFATVQTAIHSPNFEGAAFIGTVWAGVAVLYGAKAAEVASIARKRLETRR